MAAVENKDENKPPTGPMPNRPGEPAFQLEMSPDSVVFTCGADKKPVWCDVRLKNITSDTHSFKVKCTSAEMFRVQPPVGFVKSQETLNIRLWFQNKAITEPQYRHFFAFYHVKSGAEKNLKDIWTKTVKPDGVRRMLAVFNEKNEK